MTEVQVGDIVHYVSRGSQDGVFASECRAAIVTQLHETDGLVGLAVLNPTGLFFDIAIMYADPDDKETEPGSWHYKESCDE